jgi:hypothetical protein
VHGGECQGQDEYGDDVFHGISLQMFLSPGGGELS